MQIEINVSPDNGESYTVTARERDVLNWEKRQHGRSVAQFEQNPRLSDVYEIAHIAARRQGLYNDSLQQFEDEHDVNAQPPKVDSDPFQTDR